MLRACDNLQIEHTAGEFMSNYNRSFTGNCSIAICSGCLLMLAGTAQAQNPPAEKSALNALLEEVVVTARKREETLHDTPISITAISGDSLEIRGFTSIAEIEKITPNLTYQSNPQAGGSSSVATVYIRGVGQRDFLGTIDNGVGFYIDDVYIARTVGAIVDLLDIDRVEVLRGPQGTLFGRNSVGGAIKLHTLAPAEEFGGYFDATVGTDNKVRLRGKVDIPVSENFLTSFSALFGKQDGYVERPAGSDLGDDDVQALRGSFLWNASDSVVITFSADYSQEEENGPAFVLADAGTLAPGGFPGFHNNVIAGATCAYPGGITSTDPACYNSQWVSDQNLGTAPTFSNTTAWGTRLGVEWTLNDSLTLKSITAYRDLDSEFARDSDASPILITHFFDSFDSDQFSQELQLLGTSFDGKLDWITGLYYFDEDGTNINLLEFTIANFQSGADFATTSKAAFAQGTLHISDRLSATLGVRYTDEEKTYDPVQIVGPNNIGIPVGTPIVPLGKNKRSSSETTPLVNIAFDFTEDLMAYATYSEGFRSGGFVQRIFPPLPFVPDFGPETVKSIEAGMKFRSADGNFTLNGAVFTSDYTDIQVRTQNPGFVGFFEANVGDAEISGLELEMVWQPVEGWVIEAAYGLTDAEYTEIRVEPPLVAQVTLDSEFDHVPKHSGSVAVSKEFNLASGAFFVVRAGGTFHSGYFNNPDNTPSIETPATDLWDVTGTWFSPSGKYSVNGGVKNLTDEKYLATGYNNVSIGTVERIYDRGRQWYVNMRVSF